MAAGSWTEGFSPAGPPANSEYSSYPHAGIPFARFVTLMPHFLAEPTPGGLASKPAIADGAP